MRNRQAGVWIVLAALVGALLSSAWVIVVRDAVRHPASDGAAAGYVH